MLLVLGARRCFVLVLAAARARHPTRLNVATRARASLCFLSLPFSCSTLEMAPCFHSSARRSARRLVATRAWRATLLRAISRYCPCSTLDIATRCRLCQTRGGGDVFLLVLGARRCLMLALAAARARNSMLLLPIGLDALIALYEWLVLLLLSSLFIDFSPPLSAGGLSSLGIASALSCGCVLILVRVVSTILSFALPSSASVRLACPVKCEDCCLEKSRRGASPITTHDGGYRAPAPIHPTDGDWVTDPQGTLFSAGMERCDMVGKKV